MGMTPPCSVRCTHCKNADSRLIERISRPIWASQGWSMFWCAVCAKTFLVNENDGKPSALY